MAVQTTYPETMRPAVAGMKADMTPARILSRVVENGPLAFGAAAVQGTGDNQVRPSEAGRALVGVAISDPTVVPLVEGANPDAYPTGHVAAIMAEGTVWVAVGEAVAAGDPAYVVPATGAFMKTATGNTLIGKFETSAANGALAKLRVAL